MDTRPIYDLLQRRKLSSAIELLERLIDETIEAGQSSRKLRVVEEQLTKIKARWKVALEAYQDAQNKDEFWLEKEAALIYELFDLLDYYSATERQEETSAPPPKPSTAAPAKGGSIFGRMLDAVRDRWPKRKRPSSSAPPPSPRVTTPKELDELIHEEPASGAEPPGREDSASGGSAPPPPAPQPAAETHTGGAQSPFQEGKILYAIPPNMKLSEAVRCRIRIAPKALDDELMSSGLTEEQKRNATEEGIKITPVMKVELVEAQEQAPSFEIIGRNSAEQPILPFMPTEWAYDITPKRPGHYALLLRVSAKVQIPGFGERAFDVAVLDRAIQVTTTGEGVDPDDFEEQPIPDPTWDEADEQAVHQALLLGRVDRAIERIINFVQDKDLEFRDTLMLLQFRWNDNSNQLAERVITTSDWDKVNNQVRKAITVLLSELRAHFSEAVEDHSPIWKRLNQNISQSLS